MTRPYTRNGPEPAQVFDPCPTCGKLRYKNRKGAAHGRDCASCHRKKNPIGRNKPSESVVDPDELARALRVYLLAKTYVLAQQRVRDASVIEYPVAVNALNDARRQLFAEFIDIVD